MKQTEIGMIPDDWEVKKLKDLYLFKYGDGNKNPSNNGLYPVYGANGIIGKYTKYNAQDSVVIGHMGEYAGSVIWGDGKHFVTYNGTITKPKFTDKLDAKFGYYELLKLNINRICAGSGYPFLAYDKLNILSIPLPPTLAEQQKIAKVLSDVDNVISTLEKLITKKKNLKQGTMQQLLTGKKRLPGFAKSDKFKQTEIGEIPEDWDVVNISRTCTIKARIGWQGLKSDEYLDTGDYVLVTGTDFDNGFINWKNCSYVSEWRYKQDKNIQIRKGDVLVTKDGTIGKIAFLNEIPMDGTLNSGVFVVRPKDQNRIDSVYLSLIFKSFWFDDFLEQITSGSTIIHLYQKDFVKFNFVLPEIKEQTAIANVLSSMDKEIEALNTKLEKYRNLKTGMMQQLLTGKIRLV